MFLSRAFRSGGFEAADSKEGSVFEFLLHKQLEESTPRVQGQENAEPAAKADSQRAQEPDPFDVFVDKLNGDSYHKLSPELQDWVRTRVCLRSVNEALRDGPKCPSWLYWLLVPAGDANYWKNQNRAAKDFQEEHEAHRALYQCGKIPMADWESQAVLLE